MAFERTSLVVAAALLAVSVPLVLLVTLRLQRRPAVRFSAVARARYAGRSLRWRLRRVPLVLRLLAVTFLLVGFARPRTPDRTTRVFTEGVAIQMVVDRSSSMSQPMDYEGREQSRFEVVQQVFRDFVLGDNKDLKGRPNDLIGLTSFTAFVADNCPLTLDHDNLVTFMSTMETSRGQEPGRGVMYVDPDDGTAIGDAIQYATLRLINAEQELEEAAKVRPGYTIKSKIIILLTDGEDNASSITPVKAAQFAKDNDIKVYTIAVVDRGDIMWMTDPFTGERIAMPGRTVDTRAIEQVAAITGGEFGRATSGESLKKIYEKIDKLERSRFEEQVRDYDEHFDAWWAVPLGFVFLVVEVVGRNTLFRRVP